MEHHHIDLSNNHNKPNGVSQASPHITSINRTSNPNISQHLSSDEQIMEAKKRAMMYAQSLREAREQESKALKALEQERNRWVYDHEEKSVRIEQLERELASAVETIENQRVKTSLTMPPVEAMDSGQSMTVLVPSNNISTGGFYPHHPISILDSNAIHADFRKILQSGYSSVAPPTQTTMFSAPSNTGVQNPTYSTISMAPQLKVPDQSPTTQLSAGSSTSLPTGASTTNSSDNEKSETWKELLNQYKDQLQKAREDIVQLVSEKKHLANKVVDLTNSATKAAEDKEQLRIKLIDLEGRLQFRANQVREYEQEKLNREESDRQTSAKLENDRMSIASLNAQVSILENENKIALQSISTLESQLKVSQQMNNNLESKIGDLQIQVVDKDYKIKQWEIKLKDAEDQYTKDLLEMKHALNTLQLQLARAEIMKMQPPTYSSFANYMGDTPNLQLPKGQYNQVDEKKPDLDELSAIHSTGYVNSLGEHNGKQYHGQRISEPLSNTSDIKQNLSENSPSGQAEFIHQQLDIRDQNHGSSRTPTNHHLHQHRHISSPGFNIHEQIVYSNEDNKASSSQMTPKNAGERFVSTPKETEKISRSDNVIEGRSRSPGIAAREFLPVAQPKHVVTIPSPKQPIVGIDDSDLSLSVELIPQTTEKTRGIDSEKHSKKSMKKNGGLRGKSKTSQNHSENATPRTAGVKHASTHNATPRSRSRSFEPESKHSNRLNGIDSHKKSAHANCIPSGHHFGTPQSIVTHVDRHEVMSTAKKITKKSLTTPTHTPKKSTDAPFSTVEVHRKNPDSHGKTKLK